MPTTDRIVIPKCDNFHVHLRDGVMLRLVAPVTAKVFRRALVMPNVPEVATAGRAVAYRAEILAATGGTGFEPLMTIKLTHDTDPRRIAQARDAGVVSGKLYPQGVTTGAHGGIRDPATLDDVFLAMQTFGMVLCIHAEEPSAFILERESAYLGHIRRILDRFPDLRVVIEHISTADAVDLVASSPHNLAATITPVHLLADLDWVLKDGIHPHNFMYPVPKTPRDRGRLVGAATSGGPRFFAGTDSAPHARCRKEAACGCAGVFSEPVALPVYTSIFERHAGPDWADALAGFLSRNGADFYGLPRNKGTLALVREPWTVPERYGEGDTEVVPFLAGRTLEWRVDGLIEVTDERRKDDSIP